MGNGGKDCLVEESNCGIFGVPSGLGEKIW